MSCPKCGRTATFHGHRPKTFVTLLGAIEVRRAYYRCGCGEGCFPFDDRATRTGRGLSLAAEELTALAGCTNDSFAAAAERVLLKMAGIRLGESTVERVTEEAGARLGEELGQGGTYGEASPWDWHTDRQGRGVAYFSVDATGVPQQGTNGAKAEGRMPYVATIYNPKPELVGPPRPRHLKPAQPAEPPMPARYLAGLYTLPLLGLLLRKQAAQVGAEAAEVWVGISDGGGGLEEFLRTNFNRSDLVLILDFYHPASRLEELAKLYHPQDEAKAQEVAGQWCGLLKHQGGQALLERLRSQPPPRGKTAREKYREMVGYVENHAHKMDYPHYLEQGWQIGSGPVESACKTVVGQRLKLAGMRWGEPGTDSVCHLRALLKSELTQWDAFWSRRLNKGSIFYQPK